MVQTTNRSRKQRIEAAIAHALAREWEPAAEENRALLADFPDDLEAANRLGKALTELGDVKAAIEAYELSLKIDPANAIARKNIARLQEEAAQTKGKGKSKSKGKAAKKLSKPSGGTIRTSTLIAESAKTAIFELHKPNARALNRISAGDSVELEPSEEHGLIVKSGRATLGHIEPRAGQRLKRLMAGGNRYEAAVRAVGDTVSVLVREVYRAPALLDEPSFLAPSSGARKTKPRAYTRDSVVRREAPVMSSDDDDEDDVWDDDSDEEDEMEESGFGEEDPDAEEDADDSDDDDETVNSNDEDDDDIEEDEDLDNELSNEFGEDDDEESDEDDDEDEDDRDD